MPKKKPPRPKAKLSDDAARLYHERALATARRKGFAEIAEDIAQEVMRQFVEKGRPGQTIDQAVIDAVRVLQGSSRYKAHEVRQSIAFAVPLGVSHLSTPGDLAQGRLDEREFYEALKKLQPDSIEHALCALTCLYGFKVPEAARVLGISTQYGAILLHEFRAHARKRRKTA